MNRCDITIPEYWPNLVKQALIHVASLAHYSIIYTRSWAADSRLQRVRLAVKLDKAKNEISLLMEELRIKNIRMEKIPAIKRPYYPPVERLAILELRAARGWNNRQTAERFMIEPETVASWLKRIDDDSLINIPEPLNKFPAFVRYISTRMKALCPIMGKKRIAELLGLAGLQISCSSIGRFMKTSLIPPNVPSHPIASSDGQHISARHSNHVWHVDLTLVPVSNGFWQSWLPWSSPQIWPFCWWIAVVIDNFSRKIMGFAVFRKQPTSLEVRSFLGRAMSRNKCTPKHIISDRGKQFDCDTFRKWAKRKKIQIRYGAVGKYGSIAIVERFIRSLKDECTRRILVPQDINEFRKELILYATWYNHYRPHQSLRGRTPQERYDNKPVTIPKPSAPNSQLPEMALHVSYLEGRKHLPVIELKTVPDPDQNRRAA